MENELHLQEIEIDIPEYDLSDIVQKGEKSGKWLNAFAERNAMYITKRETARILGVTERKVNTYVRLGYLKQYKVEGKKRLYFSVLDVIALAINIENENRVDFM